MNDRKKKNLKIIESSENESEPEFKDNLASSDEDAPSTSKPKARVNLLSKVGTNFLEKIQTLVIEKRKEDCTKEKRNVRRGKLGRKLEWI